MHAYSSLCHLLICFWLLFAAQLQGVMIQCHCVCNEQVSWAAGIGVKKSPFKSLFNEDLGVTYIPWDKMPSSLQAVSEGAVIDEDSLPPPTPVTGE